MAQQEMQVRSLGWEDPLRKEIMGLHSILAWKIPPTEEPGRLQSMGLQRVRPESVPEQQHDVCEICSGALVSDSQYTAKRSSELPLPTSDEHCSLSFFKINFSWRLITLQYCGGFCHTLTWISHGCTCVPHPEPPSHLCPHPSPLGHPSAPAWSALFHASNLDW